MARSSAIFLCVLFLMVFSFSLSKKVSHVDKLDEDNWQNMLEGEWMVEFYAPWCPACKALEKIWEGLAFQKKELGINVGKIDVTDSPGLSGRFMVTALPTIYHVKDGVFRQYKSPRDKDSLVEFVAKQTWAKVEPVSSWKSPTSIQMSIISQFFKMSQVLRVVHNHLMEEYGLPTWGGYLIFAIGTIFLGAFIGLFIVCVIDCIYPPKQFMEQTKKKQKGSGGFMSAAGSNEDEIANAIKDDLVDEENSESGDSKSQNSTPNVRKRKSRKAD
ncbi:unnamed protein product [Trichogramma brassicae]|uniref:Thioredoxin domain-containing protein n=1 Tax=Trichogramma brassicae TaxID=86971 RepID=A0A6H5J3Y3_9HYME|nr:unnamed protein product [Trichogramma brassicae]